MLACVLGTQLSCTNDIYYYFIEARPTVSRDSSVGRAFDCRGKRHQTVTGSIPVREIFFAALHLNVVWYVPYHIPSLEQPPYKLFLIIKGFMVTNNESSIRFTCKPRLPLVVVASHYLHLLSYSNIVSLPDNELLSYVQYRHALHTTSYPPSTSARNGIPYHGECPLAI